MKFFNVPATPGKDDDIINLRFDQRLNWAQYIKCLVRQDMAKEKRAVYHEFSSQHHVRK